MRKRSLKTGADHGVCEKSGTTFRTGFRYSGLSGATIRTTRLPVFRIYFRGLLQKQMRKVSPNWRLFLCAPKNGSAKPLRLPLWSVSINGFRFCIIYVNRRNLYLSHTLRRWVFGSRCRRLFFLSQRLASRAFVRTNAERRRAVCIALRRLSCIKGTPPNPRNALHAQIQKERNDAYLNQETANQNRGSTDRDTKRTNRPCREKVRHNCK